MMGLLIRRTYRTWGAISGGSGSARWRTGTAAISTNWKGSRLFDSTEMVRPSFTTPSVAMDAGAQLWVFWGTGNKLDPKDTGGQDRFFAVKEKDFTSTRTKDDLEKLTTQAYQGTKAGWYIEFPLSGEKMLFDSTVFGGMALFTTYSPTFGADPCATRRERLLVCHGHDAHQNRRGNL